MIIAALLLILLGSFSAAILSYWHGGSWWMIFLAYFGGGWAGLLIGLPGLLLIGWRNRRKAERKHDYLTPNRQPSRR